MRTARREGRVSPCRRGNGQSILNLGVPIHPIIMELSCTQPSFIDDKFCQCKLNIKLFIPVTNRINPVMHLPTQSNFIPDLRKSSAVL